MSLCLFESKVDRYDRIFAKVRGSAHPSDFVRGRSEAPILSESRGFLGGFDLTMQLQVGCPGGCLFCYVSGAPRLAPADVRGRWGFEVRVKQNAGAQLARALEQGRLEDRSLYWSGVTDPYAIKPRITREIWQAFNQSSVPKRPGRIVIQSRFRPDRDVGAMDEYLLAFAPEERRSRLLVSYSIGTDREDLIQAWERATPAYQQRMRAIEKLTSAGLLVVPTLSPMGPWNDLEWTLDRFRDWGVPFVTALFFKKGTRSANTPTPFIRYLEEEFPFLLDPGWQAEQIERMAAVFGRERVLIGQEGFASLADPPFTDSVPQ